MDTERRIKHLADDGIPYIGMGVSGGEKGALWGPNLMPGGEASAWEQVIKQMLESISAKADDGAVCVAWMGKGGAGISNGELAGIFKQWNEGNLRSYLIEITSKILQKLDEETGQSLVDLILDEAAQKGTGRWTSQNSMDVGTCSDDPCGRGDALAIELEI